MELLNITQAKAQLSSVIERVTTKGEEFIIGKAGKPVAKIIPYVPVRKERKFGFLKGPIEIAEDFDTWPDDIARHLGIID